MADRRTFLVDTSVVNRSRLLSARDQLEPLLAADLVASCAMVDLEVLYSARNLRVFESVSEELAGLLETPITPETFARARAVQYSLARRGHHRLPISDLVIAAAAELAGHTVLHYDSDFERIADVTGQPQQWIVPRGSI